MTLAIIGPFIHCNDAGELIVVPKAAILVENGMISKVIVNPEKNVKADKIIILQEDQFLIPGFIDCHLHAVQFPNLGLGYDKGLLDWLEAYTFPLELQFSNEQFATRVFDAVVKRCLSVGTTTACYFASLYTRASVILGQKAAKIGQRAFIGKVNMNVERNDNYYENLNECIKETVKFIEEIKEIGSSLVKPIITPRFPLSCDMPLMKQLAELAKNENLHIQSHISENLDEITATSEKYNLPSYAAVFDEARLLTEKTILAHGVHLTNNEITLLKERGTSIIHCPASNTCLKSGLCDVRRLQSKGITVGLGTDVSGGDSYCMLNAIRAALQVSTHLEMLNQNYKALDYKEAFYLATLGGAKSLKIDKEVGNLEPGKQFDALIIDLKTLNSLLENLKTYTLEENFQRFIYSGDDRNIVQVFVNGNRVK